MDIKEYAKLVQETRTAQVQYFVTRKANLIVISRDWLKKAQVLEKKLDAETKNILAGATQGELL